MQEQERMRKSPAEAEEGAQETEFERFLQESGLNEACVLFKNRIQTLFVFF